MTNIVVNRKEELNLLVANREGGERISLWDYRDKQLLLTWRSRERFYCPDCGAPVILKLGSKRIWHFFHQTEKAAPKRVNGILSTIFPENCSSINGLKSKEYVQNRKGICLNAAKELISHFNGTKRNMQLNSNAPPSVRSCLKSEPTAIWRMDIFPFGF